MLARIPAKEASLMVDTGQTIIVSGNGETLMPDRLLAALETRFLDTGAPRDLTLVYNVIPGTPRSGTGDIRVPVDSLQPMPLDCTKVIARSAAMELKPGALVNFGFGIGAAVPQVAAEEGIADRVVFYVEHGPVGGIPNSKDAFGAGVNMMAIMGAQNIFEFYDAGRLDMTCLGMAEVAADGSVNVSYVNGEYNIGGFMDIVHATKEIVHCGTFTAGGLDIRIEGGKTNIIEEGRHIKFVNRLKSSVLSSERRVESCGADSSHGI